MTLNGIVRGAPPLIALIPSLFLPRSRHLLIHPFSFPKRPLKSTLFHSTISFALLLFIASYLLQEGMQIFLCTSFSIFIHLLLPTIYFSHWWELESCFYLFVELSLKYQKFSKGFVDSFLLILTFHFILLSSNLSLTSSPLHPSPSFSIPRISPPPSSSIPSTILLNPITALAPLIPFLTAPITIYSLLSPLTYYFLLPPPGVGRKRPHIKPFTSQNSFSPHNLQLSVSLIQVAFALI